MSNKYVAGYEPDMSAGNFHPNAFFDPAVAFANAGDPEAAAVAQDEIAAAAIADPAEVDASVEVLTAPAAETIAIQEAEAERLKEEETEGGAPAEPPVTETSEVEESKDDTTEVKFS